MDMKTRTKRPQRMPRPVEIAVRLEWPLLPWLRREARKGEPLARTVRRLLIERMGDERD
jgi:hypothetical protein